MQQYGLSKLTADEYGLCMHAFVRSPCHPFCRGAPAGLAGYVLIKVGLITKASKPKFTRLVIVSLAGKRVENRIRFTVMVTIVESISLKLTLRYMPMAPLHPRSALNDAIKPPLHVFYENVTVSRRKKKEL